MNTKLPMRAAALLALLGLTVNVAVDLDNVYEMTTAALWILTPIVAAAAAMMGGKSTPASPQSGQS